MAYQPIQMPQPDGLGGLAEFIMQARNQANVENARRAELLLRQQDSADQSQHRRALEAHSAAQLGIQQQSADALNAQRRMTGMRELTAALDAGRTDLAEQVAKTYGIPFAPKANDPRDALMKPSFETEAPKPQEPPTMDLDKADDPAAVQANEEAIKQYKAQLAGYSPETQYEFGGFQPQRQTYAVDGSTYDPQQIRDAEAERTKRNTAQFAGAMGEIKGFERFIPVYQAGVAAGLTPKEAFNEMQARMKAEDEREARDENARLQREQSDVNNRRIAGAMNNHATHNDPFKQRTADRGDEGALDAITKNVLSQTGYKDTALANRRFNDMAVKLAQKNAAVDTAVMGEWTKQAQGGAGVLSDSDLKVFYSRIGGFGVRTEEEIQKAINGQMGEGKRKLMTDASRWLAGRAAENLKTVKESLRFRLKNSAFADRTDDALGTYFPEERSAIEESRAIDRAKNRTRAGRIKGGGRDRLDEELDGL